MQITGRSSILFILCDPVHHVRGTHLLNTQLEGEGIDAAFSPLHVSTEHLADVVGSLRKTQNVRGFGITIPHKISIMPLLDGVTESARRVGSVNFVRREADGTLIGTNIDGEGFLNGLREQGISLRGRRVLQLGAGGAGRAVAFATALAGASALTIWNRTLDRAAALALDVQAAASECSVTSTDDPIVVGYDVIINTTPLGMDGFTADAPIDASLLEPGTIVADIIIEPEATPLIRAARARGLTTSIGRDMLLGQYAPMRDFIGLAGAVA